MHCRGALCEAIRLMRILIVTHYTLPHVGGVEVLADQLGRAAVAAGHDVAWVTSAGGPDAAPEETRGGIRITRVPAWNGLERALHVPYPVFAPGVVPALWRAVRAADVVHVHGFLYIGSLLALLFAWLQNKPLVVTEHVGFVPYRTAILNLLQRAAFALTTPLFLRCAEAVVTYNQRVHDWIAGRTPWPERLHFVVNGVDTDRFRPPTPEERAEARRQFGLPDERPLALFAGRFVEKKGTDLLWRSGDPAYDLLVCGSTAPVGGVDGSNVHSLGRVDHAQMHRVYWAADAFVMPSHGEGFPVAIMEAMACGLPVVAVRDPAYDTYVGAEEMIQVSPRAEEVRGAILGLVTDAARRAARGGAARARAVQLFSLAEFAHRHLDVFAAAIRSRRLSTDLAGLGCDLPTQIKLPVLRQLLGPRPAAPRADLGPGSGYNAHHVFGPGPVILVDISRENLAAIRRKAEAAGDPGRFLPVQASLHALPFRDGALASVTCTEVLEHMEDDRSAAAEMARTLRPGGRLIIEVPHTARGYADFLQKFGIRTVHDMPGPEHHYRPGYTVADLDRLFGPHGLVAREQRSFLRFVSLAIMDLISLVHLNYRRWRFGDGAWTWSDVQQIESSPVFRIYRAVFPILRLLARLDALMPPPGFILSVRFEKEARVASDDRA